MLELEIFLANPEKEYEHTERHTHKLARFQRTIGVAQFQE